MPGIGLDMHSLAPGSYRSLNLLVSDTFRDVACAIPSLSPPRILFDNMFIIIISGIVDIVVASRTLILCKMGAAV